MRFIQLAEFQPHLSNKVKVRNHHTHYGSEEDREGRDYREERRSTIDELPWLADPRTNNGDYSAPADVDVKWENAGEIHPAYKVKGQLVR